AARFSFNRSQHSDLHTLREVNLIETHAAIRDDLGKLQQASYAAAFIEQTTETESPLPEISQLMTDFLAWLCSHAAEPQNILALELKLLRELGMEPDIMETNLTPGAKKATAALLESVWPDSTRLKLSQAQCKEISHWLQGFLVFNLGHLPRNRAAALAIPG
ncbi:MAG TPA: DNA repair protein RecO C-terminal domain-containing protein, partial [Candidatus Binatia bacterium]|nr:DNA repair protein RecO C-terminal domain-containing protein [Candidatus Binatia bacterium]